MIQGVSRALIEEVKFSKSRVTTLDWASYPILRYKDAPEITTVLVNRPGAPLERVGRAGDGAGRRPRSRTRSSTRPASASGRCR